MDISEVQRALTSQGFNPGPPDGLWGRLTMNAVTEFQSRNGLNANGMLTEETTQKILAGAKAIASTGLVWLDEARRLMGTKEVSGSGSNKEILNWATDLGIPYSSDDIPWCGLFVAHCVGATLPAEPMPANPLGARNWQKFGKQVTPPVEGAVLVFWRESKTSGKGHVGFYNGEDKDAYHVLGGNQSDSVSIARVSKSRLLDARWPSSAAGLTGKVVKRKETGELSQNEA
jgi:uncharacterized protein (TIGR02594 family)